MELRLQYYSYKPRLRLNVVVYIPEPQLRDVILVREDWFDEIGKEYRSDLILGMRMEVIGREINTVYYLGPQLTVNIKPVKEL